MLRHEFDAQVEGLLLGERLAYHRGNLLIDRRSGAQFLAVENTAQAAWTAMEVGKVHLMQRRIGPGVYVYYATKRAKPHTKVEWTGCYDPTRPLHVKPPLKEAA